jgi:hypothetical protein
VVESSKKGLILSFLAEVVGDVEIGLGEQQGRLERIIRIGRG